MTECHPADVLLSFIVLLRPPLQFLAQFEVRKSVFPGRGAGPTISDTPADAAVGEGLLLVMYGTTTVALYR